jgi:hypothetical protein
MSPVFRLISLYEIFDAISGRAAIAAAKALKSTASGF